MIWTITGPSASGKTTLVKNLLAAVPSARPLQSATTRAPRPSDAAGEYEYLSSAEFDTALREGAFLWSVSPHGNLYGTRKKAINEAIFLGIHLSILVIEAVEMLRTHAREAAGEDAIRSIYIDIADTDELRRRITGRGDTPEEIERRLKECLDWNERAKRSGIPFYFLNGLQSPDAMAAEALSFFIS